MPVLQVQVPVQATVSGPPGQTALPLWASFSPSACLLPDGSLLTRSLSSAALQPEGPHLVRAAWTWRAPLRVGVPLTMPTPRRLLGSLSLLCPQDAASSAGSPPPCPLWRPLLPAPLGPWAPTQPGEPPEVLAHHSTLCLFKVLQSGPCAQNKIHTSDHLPL